MKLPYMDFKITVLDLFRPRWMGSGGWWEGDPRGRGYMYTCS